MSTVDTNTPTNGGSTVKSKKLPANDGKVYYSYSDIHDSVSKLVPLLKSEFNPNVIIAIGGGGFIPARMLRTELKIPILAVSLELYDDKTNSIKEGGIVCHQWFVNLPVNH